MSREYRELLTKAAPPLDGEGGSDLEEKRGLLSGRGAGAHVWRGNAGTSNAIRALGRDGQRTQKRQASTMKRGDARGHMKANKRMLRLSAAAGYLNRRAKRNVLRGSLSLGDR